MLNIRKLSKEYKSSTGKSVMALSEFSTDFGNSGLVFILGKSGSGKSTVLNLIGGIDAPTSGEIIIDGHSISSLTASNLDSYRNTYIGFVFQEYNLIDTYSVGKNIGLALELQGKTAIKETVDEAMRKVGLVDDNGETLFDRPPNELSGGQKQRVAIARAIIKNPKIILADEPTGALDSSTGDQLFDLLKDLSKDKLVIVVSHDRENAEKYGDRIIEIKDGRIARDSIVSARAGQDSEQETKSVEERHAAFIKSRLPFRRALALGLSGLRVKKIRLVLSVILSFMTFAFAGFAMMLGSIDTLPTEIRAMSDSGYQMITVWLNKYTDAENSLIENFNNGNAIFVFGEHYTGIQISPSDYLGSESESKTMYDFLAENSLRYFAELDPVTGAEDAKLTPDRRFLDGNNCRLPQARDEIAITDLVADLFIKNGFTAEDGMTTPITAPDDLIGKTMGGLKICGVYSTEYGDYYKRYDGEFDYEDQYEWNMYDGAAETMATYGYVVRGFADAPDDTNPTRRVLLKLSGDIGKDVGLFLALNALSGEYADCEMFTPFTRFMNNIKALCYSFVLPGIIATVVFTIFSILLTLNFMTVNIDFRKRELGILRALGAKRTDVTIICLVESMAIALVEFVLAFIAIIVACVVLNGIYFMPAFKILYWHVLVMFALCFVVTAIATITPVIKISGRKPIDIINNK